MKGRELKYSEMELITFHNGNCITDNNKYSGEKQVKWEKTMF